MISVLIKIIAIIILAIRPSVKMKTTIRIVPRVGFKKDLNKCTDFASMSLSQQVVSFSRSPDGKSLMLFLIWALEQPAGTKAGILSRAQMRLKCV